MRTVSPLSWLALLLLSATAGNVAAVEPATPSAPTPVVTASPPSGHAAKSSYIQGMGQSVDSVALAKLSGGTAIVENKMTLNGSVTNNTSDHVLTGANVISTGSFDGAVGVPMVIQNTGNSVLIQNATIINVQFHP